MTKAHGTVSLLILHAMWLAGRSPPGHPAAADGERRSFHRHVHPTCHAVTRNFDHGDPQPMPTPMSDVEQRSPGYYADPGC